MRAPELRTARLLLRGWRDADREPFAAMNADRRVMEHFPAPYSQRQSDDLLRRIEAHWREHGFGLWAVQHGADLVGFVGLSRARFEAPFTPAVEVGWRLVPEHWGRGFATEAGLAALGYGFGTVGLAEVVSFTAAGNVRSWLVMERLGMVRDHEGDFDHPALPLGHRLRRHVLYRARAGSWRPPLPRAAGAPVP